MLFISNLKFLSSVHLSVALQSKVGCFSVSQPNLGCALTDSSLGLASASTLATAISSTTALVASMAAYYTVSVTSFNLPFSTHICVCFMNTCLHIFFLTPCRIT